MSSINFKQVPHSNEIVNSICSFIREYETIHKKDGDDEKIKVINNLQLQNLDGALSYLEDTIRFINLNLSKLFSISDQDDFYFFDCSSDLYEKLYSNRLNDFIAEHKHSSELDFLEDEKSKLNNPTKNRFFNWNSYLVSYSKYLLENVDFNIARKRKLEFIENRITEIKISKSYNSNIFRSAETEEWFQKTLFEMNAIDQNNNALYGFQAVCNAIFSNKKCEEYIFKYKLNISVFVKYLTKKFNVVIGNPDKLSSGAIHENEVEKLIKLHLNT